MFVPLVLGLALGVACSIVPRAAVDAPSSDAFLRRLGHSMVVVDNHLYIDGGSISQSIPGQTFLFNQAWQMNNTLSVPLDKAWTNKTVEFTQVEKRDTPGFLNGALWREPNTPNFYSFGGQAPYGIFPDTKHIYKFSGDGGGGGSWSTATVSNPTKLSASARTEGGVSFTYKDVGYLIGGYASSFTDKESTAREGSMVANMLTYNMTSQDVTVVSTTGLGLGQFGTTVWAQAEVLAEYGTDGVVVMVGGTISQTTDTTYVYDGTSTALQDMSTIYIYDPSSNAFYTQTATGTPPSPRDRFCMVRAKGSGNTTELFIYGGWNELSYTGFDDAYVLSVPGFVWFQKNITSFGARMNPRCACVANRQMLVLGGVNPNTGFADPDPFKNGLAVMDLPTMEWRDGFDPSDDAYEPPDEVTKWYDANGMDTVVWNTKHVQAIFENYDASRSNPNDTSPGGSSNSTSTTPSNIDAGAVVAGTLGGLALLIGGSAAAFMILRRRNRKRDQKHFDDHGSEHELVSSPTPEKLASVCPTCSHSPSSQPAGLVGTSSTSCPPPSRSCMPVELDSPVSPSELESPVRAMDLVVSLAKRPETSTSPRAQEFPDKERQMPAELGPERPHELPTWEMWWEAGPERRLPRKPLPPPSPRARPNR